MKKKESKKTAQHRYTEEEKQFFKEYTFGHSHKEIQEEFYRRFGIALTIGQVQGSISRYKLNTGRTGYFEKGNVPANKGKKMSPELYEKCKDTMFKKGHISNNRPLGSERVDPDGFVAVKVAEPNKWVWKHRLVWEEHNGKIPEGHVVIFLDGNKQNFDIENLRCITKGENLYLNQNKLRFEDAELTSTGANIAKLETAIKKAMKGEEE